MESQIYVGIDYSMNSPGVCVLHGKNIDLYGFYNGYRGITGKTYKLQDERLITINIISNVEVYKTQIERFDHLARKILAVINRVELNNPIVYIEGYSMGSRGKVFDIAENTAILKHYLYRCDMEPTAISPMEIKKFATGSGRAIKDDMHDAFVRETGLNLKDLLTPRRKLGSPVTDLVDSFWVAKYAEKVAQGENERSKKHQTEVV